MEERLPYMNRELSWLKFDERVLEEAEDANVPLCERLTFASIFQTNLDEFFRVRVGSLFDQMQLDAAICDNKTGMTSAEQIEAILTRTKALTVRKDEIYRQLMKELEQHGVRIVNFNMLNTGEAEYLENYFDQEIAPLISPMIIGRSQPFPFLKNGEIHAAVLLVSRSGKRRVGIIPCTNTVLKRLIRIPNQAEKYMLLEEVILHFASKVYPKYTIKSKTLFRVTRNADIDAHAHEDEELDYRDMMVKLIRKRKKLRPIRLELSRTVDEEVVDVLKKNLELKKNYIFYSQAPLDLGFVFQLQDNLRKNTELFFEKRIPQNSSMFDMKRSIIDQVREKDRMLSFPYENVRPFLEFLHEAANDPDVLSIKMTLYRVARDSKVVDSLVEAAENGKEVIVLVELRARFDEENNIEWSRRLEDAGCRVIYGLEGYKVHSKLCLVTRRIGDKIEYLTQVGTGNYNEKTAKLYTDLMIFTADAGIGAEAAKIFQALSFGETVEQSQELMVAPKCLQNRILKMIEEEIEYAKRGEPSYIGLKLNSLTDKTIMDKLVEASCAGVKIDMVIRGISCLTAGVEGYTEHIRTISIVGRYLEHSRIYLFGAGKRQKVYIASADFMTRNTLRRVEVAIPVKSEELRERIVQIFQIMLADNCKARIQKPDGTYVHIQNEKPLLNAQEWFFQEAYARAAGEQVEIPEALAGTENEEKTEDGGEMQA